MTYLAGLDAQVIVWIATQFTEPHLAAIKWLNEHTVEPFAFFAVKLRVVRIGDSLRAPIFEVAERPNTWERQMQAAPREAPGRLRDIPPSLLVAYPRGASAADQGSASCSGASGELDTTAIRISTSAIFLDRRPRRHVFGPRRTRGADQEVSARSPSQFATRLGSRLGACSSTAMAPPATSRNLQRRHDGRRHLARRHRVAPSAAHAYLPPLPKNSCPETRVEPQDHPRREPHP